MEQQRYRWIRKAALTGALTLPVMVAGCGWFSPSDSKAVDPPQGETGSAITGADGQTSAAATGSAEVSAQGEASGLTVYLKDAEGYLAPVTIQAKLDSKLTAEAQALELLVDGGAYSKLLPEGFSGVLPQGTQVLNVQVNEKTKLATVEFSKQFSDYNEQDERTMLEAITYTLTGLDGIQGVELWEEGERLQEMPVGQYPLDRALTRAIGINLEADSGVDYSLSTPVTLYFSSKTELGDPYFVPVTRLVPRTTDKLTAALDQLTEGPLEESRLLPVWLQDVSVDKITQNKDTITLDLKDEAYKKGDVAPAEMMRAVVLSLTDNAGVDQVQIKLNGASDFKDELDTSYTEPVSRPEQLNAFKS
ncbi:GerMN domain-containing protein [Paenibacillus pasadenensis]|uniref:GerMN domain-containing protein n=1 Tax=Paenibacillus TaxID=44249 RepID=UPI0004158891|nr:GerMN domain-containing protein [Paenibacillus pasadenensis]